MCRYVCLEMDDDGFSSNALTLEIIGKREVGDVIYHEGKPYKVVVVEGGCYNKTNEQIMRERQAV